MSLVYNDDYIFNDVFIFKYGFPKSKLIFKLISSHVDEPYIKNIIGTNTNSALDKNGNPLPSNKKWSKRGMHPLYVAYNMFRDYLEELRSKGKYVYPDHIKNGVKFINMCLSGNDDPQIYFDNINTLGVRLTTSAIIKNYVFSNNQNGYQDYKTSWEPIFESPTTNKYWNGDGTHTNLDEFLYFFLQVKTYDKSDNVKPEDKASYSRKDGVANHIKDYCHKYLKDNVKLLLHDIIQFSDIYSKIVFDNIGQMTSLDQCTTIDDKLARIGYLIKKLRVSTMIPYLLFMVDKNKTNTQNTLDILDYLESYLIRRSLIDADTNNYNKFFKEILIAKDILTLQDLKNELSPLNNNSTDMPSDNDILSNLGTLDFQGDNETPKALLFMYEMALCKQNKAQVKPLAPDSYTLEHIMPQKLDPMFWPGPNQSPDHIYKLGNMGLLTQTLQSILKNRGWNNKLNGFNGKPGLKICCSGLYSMNNVINQSSWDDNIIDMRTNTIISGLLSIWKA